MASPASLKAFSLRPSPACRLAAGVILSLLAACNSVSGTDREEFIVRVDSITGPNAVSGGAAFDSHFWGTVGTDGCYSFKEIHAARGATQVDVTVIGEHVRDQICTQNIVILAPVSLRVEPIIPTPFFIVVHQPDGSTLVRRIFSE